MENLTGKQLNRYQIDTPLGQGGMAAVYKAYHPDTERFVALKILPKNFASDPEFVGRFEQEAKLIAQLQHPHILPVFDYGEAEGYTYIVMPYIETGTLADVMQGKPLPLEQIRKIISQVGDALDYAHSRGIVHRDVKPSNILIDERGNCLLTDFGIAKLAEGTQQFTRTGGVVGTPAYMSPEQGLGEKPDARSDVYSLGVVLYELATGQLPFDADTPMALAIKHIHEPLPPPRTVNPYLSESVANVIVKALNKERNDRYATAAQMISAMQVTEEEDEAATVVAETIRAVEADIPPIRYQPPPVIPAAPPAPRPAAARSKAKPQRFNIGRMVGCLAVVAVVAFVAVVGLVIFGPKALSFIQGNRQAVVETAPPTTKPNTYIAPTTTPKPEYSNTAAVSPEIIFQDDFSNPSSGWDRVNVTDGVTDYVDGTYRIFVNKSSTDIWANPGLDISDAIIEVQATKFDGPDDNDFGVICRYVDVENFYQFIISSDGYYGVGKVIGGTQELLENTDLRPTGAIRQGNTTNEIQAKCVGDMLTLIVNGDKIIDVRDSTFTSGDVGLFAGTYDEKGTDIRFDNFIVTTP